MSETIAASGSCICGACTVAVENMQKSIGVCHCSTCRHWGGPLLASSCGTTVVVTGKEPDSITVYNSSEWAERGFCKHCGSHLFYRIKQDQSYHVPVGLFGDTEFKLKQELFVEQKPQYYTFAEDTETLTGAELFAKFS